LFGSGKQGALYQGTIENSMAEGFGTVSFANGPFFEGSFSRGEPTNGIFVISKNVYYVGDIGKCQALGRGMYENTKNGYFYEGDWKKNMQHGKGFERYSNRDEYRGEFMCGSKFG
jgi:hypothetical protein